jgi:hypothetical protein
VRNRTGELRFEVSPDVKASVREDGIVLLHIARGLVFTSNRVGARIWQGLAASEGLAAITEAISREHGITRERATHDAAAFISTMETEGLLVRHGSY